VTRPEIIDWMDKNLVRAQPTAEAHPTTELRAYLVQRGRAVARDMDLGQVQDQDLYRLGELDVIAAHPDVPHPLVLYLEMIRPCDQHVIRAPKGAGQGPGGGSVHPTAQHQHQHLDQAHGPAPKGAQGDSARPNPRSVAQAQRPGAPRPLSERQQQNR
jgi:hypothetical protein